MKKVKELIKFADNEIEEWKEFRRALIYFKTLNKNSKEYKEVYKSIKYVYDTLNK